MLDESYLLVFSHAFVTPTNPGVLPIVLDDETVHTISEIIRQHKSTLQIYHEVKNTEKALKQLIIETFDDDCTNDLRDPNIGFANVLQLPINITKLSTHWRLLKISGTI